MLVWVDQIPQMDRESLAKGESKGKVSHLLEMMRRTVVPTELYSDAGTPHSMPLYIRSSKKLDQVILSQA